MTSTLEYRMPIATEPVAPGTASEAPPSTAPGARSDAERRSALGRFLRVRRERLLPLTAGLPAGRRRRTPGLRREEVAELAEVGVAWYTWLEQGRDVRASEALLARLAGALRLDPAERDYLFALARGDARGDARGHAAPAARPGVAAPVQAILDALDPVPAYVLDARWDLLAWNAAAVRVFADFGALPPEERNLLRVVLTHPSQRARLVDWAARAREAVWLFRAQTARYVGEAWHAALVGRLSELSPEFGRWWPATDLAGAHPGLKEIDVPAVGRLTLAPTTLLVADAPDLRLFAYPPAPGSDALAKLDALARQSIARESRRGRGTEGL